VKFYGKVCSPDTDRKGAVLKKKGALSKARALAKNLKGGKD